MVPFHLLLQNLQIAFFDSFEISTTQFLEYRRFSPSIDRSDASTNNPNSVK